MTKIYLLYGVIIFENVLLSNKVNMVERGEVK